MRGCVSNHGLVERSANPIVFVTFFTLCDGHRVPLLRKAQGRDAAFETRPDNVNGIVLSLHFSQTFLAFIQLRLAAILICNLHHAPSQAVNGLSSPPFNP